MSEGVVTVKVELGSGQRPTDGYLATDAHPFPGVRTVHAWGLDMESGTVDEVIALGVMEHLTFGQFHATVANARRMLRPGGRFLFDVPDLPVWCRYLVDAADGLDTPFPMQHILATLYGWQRWEGDEHKSGWTRAALLAALDGWTVTFDLTPFLELADRRRFHRPADAHLYVVAVK